MPVVGEIERHPHLLGDFRQPLFDAADRGAELLRFRQTKQREGAIGFELEQALHQRAGAFRAEAAVDDKNAHEARRVELEIGRIERGAVGILRDRKARAVEDAFRRDPLACLGDEMQVDRREQRTRLRQQAHRRGER